MTKHDVVVLSACGGHECNVSVRGVAAVVTCRFGELLKQYREELGLTQRTLAMFLGVDASTIARVEAGTRLPPKDVGFYHGLRDVPGLDESHVRALMSTVDAPRLVTPDNAPLSPTDPLPRVAVVDREGIRMTLQLAGDREVYSSEDLDKLQRSMEDVLRAGLAAFLRPRSRGGNRAGADTVGAQR